MKAKSSSVLPAGVRAVIRYLERTNDQPRLALIGQLAKPEHAAMWKALECRSSGSNESWVHAFLAAVEGAMKLPPYYCLSGRERRLLCDRLRALSVKLANLYRKNDLDIHFVKLDGEMWNGFYAFEDFSDSFRADIEAEGDEKLSVVKIIETMADRAVTRIGEAKTRGKAGKNVRAIQFVRKLAERNMYRYGTPLNAVVATAANALFGTSYGESDIRKLLSRHLGNPTSFPA